MDPVIKAVLAPLERYYGDTSTVEVRLNKPCHIILDRRGSNKTEKLDKELTFNCLDRICRTLSNFYGLSYSHAQPLVSCILPQQQHRFEALLGKSARHEVSLAIRCKHKYQPNWSDFGINTKILKLLEKAVESEKNIIISGATNTGKTTLLNMLLSLMPKSRRVIACEDTPEISLSDFWDGQGLIAARSDKDKQSGLMTWRTLYDHCKRITPDHIIFGEISTENAYSALSALNEGATGFMCTIHSESSQQALKRKFSQNMNFAGYDLPNVPEYLGEMIDLVIQIKRSSDGFRRISEIYLPRKQEFFYHA